MVLNIMRDLYYVQVYAGILLAYSALNMGTALAH